MAKVRKTHHAKEAGRFGLDGPHNVVFTRDKEITSNKIYCWDVTGQVRKFSGCWFQLKLQWAHTDIGNMSLASFKALFGYTLPKGKAVNGRISLCGGLRTR